MNKLELKYPCEWEYTVIGADEALLRSAVAEEFRGKEFCVEFSKKSKAGKYVSLNIKTTVVSEDERVRLGGLLGKQSAVKVVI